MIVIATKHLGRVSEVVLEVLVVGVVTEVVVVVVLVVENLAVVVPAVVGK